MKRYIRGNRVCQRWWRQRLFSPWLFPPAETQSSVLLPAEAFTESEEFICHSTLLARDSTSVPALTERHTKVVLTVVVGLHSI